MEKEPEKKKATKPLTKKQKLTKDRKERKELRERIKKELKLGFYLHGYPKAPKKPKVKHSTWGIHEEATKRIEETTQQFQLTARSFHKNHQKKTKGRKTA